MKNRAGYRYLVMPVGDRNDPDFIRCYYGLLRKYDKCHFSCKTLKKAKRIATKLAIEFNYSFEFPKYFHAKSKK